MTSLATKLALAFLMFAITTASQATDADTSSLLRCGVNFGGKTLTYDGGSQTKDKRDKRLNHVMGAVTPKSPEFTPAMATDTMSAAGQSSDTRLPPKFTLATIGCSWR